MLSYISYFLETEFNVSVNISFINYWKNSLDLLSIILCKTEGIIIGNSFRISYFPFVCHLLPSDIIHILILLVSVKQN